MKIIIIALTLVIRFTLLQAQQVESAPADKAVVYFLRPNGYGGLINFTFYDGEKLIGKFNGVKYMRYECEPGEHYFWARSENKSYLKANIDAGRIYLVEAMPLMGGLKAAVQLIPINPDSMWMKKHLKLLSQKPGESFSETELAQMSKNAKEATVRGLSKLERIKANDFNFPELRNYMYAEPNDLVPLSKEESKKERKRLKMAGKAEKRAYYDQLKLEKEERKVEKETKKLQG